MSNITDVFILFDMRDKMACLELCILHVPVFYLSKKLSYLILKLYFEVAKLLMSEIFSFSCLSRAVQFIRHFICLLSRPDEKFMQVISYFPKLVFLKTGILKNFCHKIFTNMLLSWTFWHSFGLVFRALCHTTCLAVS